MKKLLLVSLIVPSLFACMPTVSSRALADGGSSSSGPSEPSPRTGSAVVQLFLLKAGQLKAPEQDKTMLELFTNAIAVSESVDFGKGKDSHLVARCAYRGEKTEERDEFCFVFISGANGKTTRLNFTYSGMAKQAWGPSVEMSQ